MRAETDGTFRLEPERSYAFRIREELGFPSDAPFCGQATPKSSIGRLDVITRLVVSGMVEYDTLSLTTKQQIHEMYVEVTPMTFPIRVREGTSLNQLRLFYGALEDAELRSGIARTMYLQGSQHADGSLSVDLSPTEVSGLNVVAFRAQREVAKNSEPLCVWDGEKSAGMPNPSPLWQFLPADKERLTIQKNDFYLLRSKERITLPAGVAVYCKAMDETLGEMRIHYAGFVHPGFGQKRSGDKVGTPLIFEVRGHDIDVNLAHGEKLARLVFYRMSEDAPEEPSAYNDQELTLSKFFARFPSQLKLVDGNYSVAPIS